MKKTIIFLVVLIVLLGVFIQIGILPKKQITPKPTPSASLEKEVVVQGSIVDVTANTRSLTIMQNSQPVYLLLLENATIQNSQGKPIKLADLQKGFVIEAKSKVQGSNFFIVSSLTILKETTH